MTAPLVFAVDGTPAPQGSKKAFLPKGSTRPVIVDDNKAPLRAWRSDVRAAAIDTIGDGPRPYFPGDVAIRLTFAFVRPASAKGRRFPGVKPDLDKLVRAALDALTDAATWVDDSRVVRILATKVYKDRPGVLIEIQEVL